MRGARAVGSFWARKDAAGSEDENVAVRELLLELAGETVNMLGGVGRWWLDLGEFYRCWTLWKPWRRGTGTKMTIAFLPWPTSI